MRLAKRIDRLPPYLFVEINRKIEEKKAQGVDIISFAIGDPDLPTPDYILDKLCAEARNPVNHRYPETAGLPELCQEITGWYQKRFNIKLDPATEVLPLIGSKEGIAHISFCYIEQGDMSLVTDPGYPVYGISTILAGGEPYYLPINEDNNFLPDLDSVPDEVLKKAKLLWLNYPNNPTGAVAEISFFEKAVKFAKKNNLLICHDTPYTEVSYDKFKAPSILQVSSGKDVAVEFNSFSKTYNMTGWRIGWVVGNRDMVNALFRFKSNLDSGIPQAIQQMAMAAFKGPQYEIDTRNAIYQRRRDKLCSALKEVGIQHQVPQAGLYVWAKVPKGFTSVQFVNELLDKANIAVTPGTGYGPNGEGHIRFSITLPDKRLDEGIERLLAWYKQNQRK
jgi:LL-diaminopimelate aminotransferase